MPLPPFPVPPNPRTWSLLDFITEPRLRADLANAALLLANRPLFAGQQTTTAQQISSGVTTAVDIDTELNDSWGGHQIPQPQYFGPFSGWYLCSGNWFMNPSTATRIQAAGIQRTQNGSALSIDGSKITGNGTALGSATACDLVQLIQPQGDSVALTAFQDSGSSVNLPTGSFGANFSAEWVALPTTANGYAGPLQLGTVVPSPPAPAPWPPGAGTTITSTGGIAAGAVSVKVASATGLIIGGPLVLDAGNLIQEAVTVTSISGTTIGFTPATAYSHAHTAPVATPVGSAWLNSQVRDLINFLAYPPILRAEYAAGTASLASSTWPTSNQIPVNTAGVDNFGGFSGNAYTFPVSGEYECYGQVYCAGSANNMSLGAGLQVSGGSVLQGDTLLNTVSDSAQYQCATVRRLVRVTAGQTLELFGTQDSGAGLTLQGSAGKFCLLIAVWRSF